jgi:Pectate lyase superfamily protein/Calx-beta domain
MAGLRHYANPLISSLPAAVRDGQGVVLLEAGFIDVTKAPYNADPTGQTDSAAAFQAAIDFGYANCFAVWVPKGAYLLSRGLELYQNFGFMGAGGSNRKFAPQLVGDTFGGDWPVLRAADGALGSGILIHCHFDPDDSTGPTRLYNVLLRGFQIDMGGNPQATAISFSGAQWCSLEDIHIHGASFNIGVRGLPGSGGSTTNLTVTGGNTGILQDVYRPTPSVHGLRLFDQVNEAIRLTDVRNALCLVGFEIRGAAGIVATARGTGQPNRNLVLTDGAIDVAGTALNCVGSNIYAKNVFVRAGNATVMRNGTTQQPVETLSASGWQHIRELAFAEEGQGNNSPIWINGATTSPDGFVVDMVPATAPDAAPLIAAHSWAADAFPSWFHSEMLDVRDFGAVPDQPNGDNSAALNAALAASAAQGKPAFLPRGFWYVKAPVECPVGAQLFGSSYTNCVIKSSKQWQPTGYTAIFRTADAAGDVRLADFCVDGHEGAASQGITSHKLITVFHGRSSNMLLRCVQINRQEYFAGGQGHYDAPVALFTGNAGGRIYNLALDLFHGTAALMAPGHRMILIDGTTRPLTIYQPDSEGTRNAPQCEIRGASNVVWHAFKFEDTGSILLRIANSTNINVLGGSGNYEPVSAGMFQVQSSQDVVVTIQGRQGNTGGVMLARNGQTIAGSFRLLSVFRAGAPTLPVMPPFPFSGAELPPPLPELSIADAEAVEGDTAMFEVALSEPSSVEVLVDFQVTGVTAVPGLDFVVESQSPLVVPAGERSALLKVFASPDGIDEPNKTFLVTLSNPVNAVLADAEAVGTILDDDEPAPPPQPELSVADAEVVEGDIATFEVALSAPSAVDVLVDFQVTGQTAVPGLDFVSDEGTLVVEAGEQSALLEVTTIDDDVDEPNKTFLVTLSNPVNAVLTDAEGMGTILDDDAPAPPPLPELSVADGQVAESAGTAWFEVTLSAASEAVVEVDWAATGETAVPGVDFLTASGRLQIPPGDLVGMIGIDIIADGIDESDKTFLVTLSNPVNAVLADVVAVGTILDDDEPAPPPPDACLPFSVMVQIEGQSQMLVGTACPNGDGTWSLKD